MCGLMAVISKYKGGLSRKEVDIFSQLLLVGEIRGSDGTGMFFNTKRNEPVIRVAKGAAHSSDFLNYPEYGKIEDTLVKQSNFVVGHNRSATRGKLNTASTHPFREGHITLVHNGTLTTQTELHPTAEVDSHAICHSMASRGERETIKMLDGAFALIWFNTKTKKLSFCRNWARPLWILDCGFHYVLVSEKEMGDWIVSRNGGKVTSMTEVKPKVLYSFDIDNFQTWQEEDLEFKTWVNKAPVVQSFFPPLNQQEWKNGMLVPKETNNKVTNFAFGEKVRFRGGFIRNIGMNTKYLEGDILKNQSFPMFNIPVKADFEDLQRIKVFGTEQELLKLAHEKNLIGTIIRTMDSGVYPSYVLANVELYTPPIATNGLSVCDWCNKIADKLTILDEYNVCQDCYDTFHGNAALTLTQ